MRDFIDKLMANSTYQIVAAAVGVILIVITAFIIIRLARRRRENSEQLRGELIMMEREAQLHAAVEQAQYQKSSEEGARQMAAIFRDYLSMPVVAIYVGRQGEPQLTSIFSEQPSTAQLFGAQAASTPQSIPASFLMNFARPQITTLAALFGARQPAIAAGRADVQTVGPATTADAYPVAVISWRAAFGWQGVTIARTQGEINNEQLAQLHEAITRLANKLAVALEMDQLRVRDTRSERATQLARALLSADSATIYETVAREVAAFLQSDSAALWLVDQQASIVKMAAQHGLQASEFLPLPIGQGFAGTIVQQGEILAIQNAPEDGRCLFPREAIESGIYSYLGAPVIADGNIIGAIEVHTCNQREWTDQDAEALETAAAMIAQPLKAPQPQSANLKAENAYLSLSESLQRLRSRDELLEAAVEVLGHALAVSRAAAITLTDAGQAEPVRIEYRSEGVKSAVGATFANEVILKLLSATQNGDPVSITDSHAGSPMSAEWVSALQVASEMIIPLRVEGQTRAFIYLHQCDRQKEWGEDETEFAARVGRQLSLSLTNLRALMRASGEAQAAREEIRRAHDSIAQSQGIINNMPEAVLCLDAEGRMTFYNAVARQWLGLKNEDLGKRPQACEALQSADPALWAEVSASRSIIRLEGQITRPSSHEAQGAAVAQAIPVHLAVAPIRTGKTEATGHVVILRDARQMKAAQEAAPVIAALEKKKSELEHALTQSRDEQIRLRDMLDKAQKAYEEARAAASAGGDAGLREAYERLSADAARLRNSSQHLLEINRLKSEFIVNAGRELESSLQSLMGFVALLEQGSYGPLTNEQIEAVSSMQAWARRMKIDVDALIDYGSTRARRLDAIPE
ncbi:MAG: GAF domain-containing protein [Acidobacteriota bacterium]